VEGDPIVIAILIGVAAIIVVAVLLKYGERS
jgi:hypothetical protein